MPKTMKNYKKNFLNFFNLSEYDEIPATMGGGPAVDLHHLVFKKSGGSSQNLDEAWNLIPVTREQHNSAHDNPSYNETLKVNHFIKLIIYVAERLGFHIHIGEIFKGELMITVGLGQTSGGP